MSHDPYGVLGVPRDADEKAIKQAFRKLARELHPDVAGADEAKAARFRKVRAAYELLMDPARRARHDRLRWRVEGQPFSGRAPRGGTNDIGLEDIFGDHGGFVDFGFGRGPAKAGRPPPQARTRRPEPKAREPERPAPEPGDDVQADVEVPRGVAARGGLVSLRYVRRVRADGRHELHGVEELHELRVPGGTVDGDLLRVERLGHAGAHGGRYGDLVARVRLVGPAPRVETSEVAVPVEVALLGGRVEASCPGGTVRLSIPPGTSGGTLLRVRGKGAGGADHQLRVVVQVPADAAGRAALARALQAGEE